MHPPLSRGGADRPQGRPAAPRPTATGTRSPAASSSRCPPATQNGAPCSALRYVPLGLLRTEPLDRLGAQLRKRRPSPVSTQHPPQLPGTTVAGALSRHSLVYCQPRKCRPSTCSSTWLPPIAPMASAVCQLLRAWTFTNTTWTRQAPSSNGSTTASSPSPTWTSWPGTRPNSAECRGRASKLAELRGMSRNLTTSYYGII